MRVLIMLSISNEEDEVAFEAEEAWERLALEVFDRSDTDLALTLGARPELRA